MMILIGVFMSQVVHTKIQKWGNGLALRVAGLIRDIPQFEQNTAVDVEIFEDGFTVKKSKPQKKGFVFPLKEKDLLKDMTADLAHADALAEISLKEIEL
jgi:antitoxin MazE